MVVTCIVQLLFRGRLPRLSSAIQQRSELRAPVSLLSPYAYFKSELLEKRHMANITVAIVRFNVFMYEFWSLDVDLAVAGESKSKPKSKSHYDWRSVSQYVLMSSPIWNFWPEIFFPNLLSCLFGAPSLMRGLVCHLSVFVIAVHNSQSLFTTNIYIKIKMYIVLHLQ
jgi:hypothetical protein